jgi:hypothetical protein
MRLPVNELEQNMRQMLEGLLLWSEDSKNKFRLKVRPSGDQTTSCILQRVCQALVFSKSMWSRLILRPACNRCA